MAQPTTLSGAVEDCSGFLLKYSLLLNRSLDSFVAHFKEVFSQTSHHTSIHDQLYHLCQGNYCFLSRSFPRFKASNGDFLWHHETRKSDSMIHSCCSTHFSMPTGPLLQSYSFLPSAAPAAPPSEPMQEILFLVIEGSTAPGCRSIHPLFVGPLEKLPSGVSSVPTIL